MDEIELLASTTEKFFAEHRPLSRVREALRLTDGPGFDRALWREEAALGWTGLAVPAALGGADVGTAATGRVLEICGRFLVPEPFLTTLALATPVLNASRGDRARELLTGIASGDVIVAVGVPSSLEFASGRRPISARETADGSWRMTGVIPIIVDAPDADWIVFPAATEGGDAWFGIPREAASPGRSGILIDGRRAGELVLDLSLPGRDALATPPHGSVVTEQLLSTGAMLVASWLLGLSERAFELTLEHLRTRQQFGARIGSFQALQHWMARLHCDLVVARSVVEAAQRGADQRASNADLLASAAKSRMGALARDVTGAAIQLHGGIGMTEDHDIGFYFKGARMGDALAGHRALHKRRAMHLLGF